MATKVEDIKDPLERELCAYLEVLAHDWRESVRTIGAMSNDLAIVQANFPMLDQEPDFSSYLSAALAAVRRLGDVSNQLREKDARVRVDGFDARRNGLPVTANPHMKVRQLSETEREEEHCEYELEAMTRAAIPWYIGWKQGARAGQEMFP